MRDINMESIRAIDRAIDVLEAFSVEKSSFTIEEVSKATELPKNTVYRILYTLERRDLIKFDPNSLTYHPGVKLLEFALLKSYILDIQQEAEPFLNDLHLKTNETVLMALREETEIFYVYKRENENYEGLKVSTVVGVRRPYRYGVLGPVILAFQPKNQIEYILNLPLKPVTPPMASEKKQLRERLQKIREEGVYVESNETSLGVTGIGAPIFNAGGEAIAAIGVVGPEVHLKDQLEEVKRLVKEIAKTISRRMGHR